MQYLNLILIINILLSSVFAGLLNRNLARVRNGGSNVRLSTSISESIHTLPTSNNSHVTYSTNWAGAVLKAPPTDSKFEAVSAQFTVPSLRGYGEASAWVGIDGDTYSAAILQTGVDFILTNGEPTYKAWYEWYPNNSQDFPEIEISAGDVIRLTVISTSPMEGIVEVNNLTRRQRVSKTLTASSAHSTLAGQNAEWIVEDFIRGDVIVPFLNFGKVEFTNSVTRLSTGSTISIHDAEVLEIVQNNRIMTSSKISETTLSVEYL